MARPRKSFTLERAEVLRGPSAVLYGAGSSGGLLNAVSKRPQFDDERRDRPAGSATSIASSCRWISPAR